MHHITVLALLDPGLRREQGHLSYVNTLNLAYTLPPAFIILLGAWIFMRQANLAGFARAILAAAAFIISMSTAIAVSFRFLGYLQPILIFPICALLTGFLAFEIRISVPPSPQARVSTPWYTTLVVVLMVGVVALGTGRQFQYKSAWGDIGAYLTAAQHYNKGGSATFRYASRGSDLAQPDKPLPLTGVVMDAPGGMQQFHALPVWPGWMALFGTDQQRAIILPLLFAFAIGAFYTLATRLFQAPLAGVLSTLALALLPVMWFQSLYATAEMLALVIVLATLVLIVTSRTGLLATALGIFAYGTTHISLTVLLPLITAALVAAAITPCRDRWWPAKAAVVVTASAICATLFAFNVSRSYSTSIFSSLFGGHGWLVWAVVAGPITALPVNAAFVNLASVRNGVARILSSVLQHARIIGLSLLLLIGCSLVVQAYRMGWTTYFIPETTSIYTSASARVAYMDKGFNSLSHLSMLSLLGASGIIGLAAFVALPFSWRPFPDKSTVALWAICAYAVIVYGVVHVDVTNNYYMSRYFVPFAMPMLLLLSVPWLDSLGNRALGFLLAAPVALYYVSVILVHGFFAGDAQFVTQINQLIGKSQSVYVAGSNWLRFLVAPSLMESGRKSGAEGLITEQRKQQPVVLVTDDPTLSTTRGKCITFIERRIPWQIGYLTKPELDRHIVCVAHQASGPETLTFGANHWLVGGNMTFPVQAPSHSLRIRVRIISHGWWATKKPFIDHAKLQPRLIVCDRPFKLVKLSPTQVAFAGTMTQPACKASLQTATFVPSEIGEGSDSRALGMDLRAIVIAPDWKR